MVSSALKWLLLPTRFPMKDSHKTRSHTHTHARTHTQQGSVCIIHTVSCQKAPNAPLMCDSLHAHTLGRIGGCREGLSRRLGAPRWRGWVCKKEAKGEPIMATCVDRTRCSRDYSNAVALVMLTELRLPPHEQPPSTSLQV